MFFKNGAEKTLELLSSGSGKRTVNQTGMWDLP
jgi:hypothetical protein